MPASYTPLTNSLPTAIQAEAIPLILGGGDVLAVRIIPPLETHRPQVRQRTRYDRTVHAMLFRTLRLRTGP